MSYDGDQSLIDNDQDKVRIGYSYEQWNGYPTLFILHNDSTKITVLRLRRDAKDVIYADTEGVIPVPTVGLDVDPRQFEQLCNEWQWK